MEILKPGLSNSVQLIPDSVTNVSLKDSFALPCWRLTREKICLGPDPIAYTVWDSGYISSLQILGVGTRGVSTIIKEMITRTMAPLEENIFVKSSWATCCICGTKFTLYESSCLLRAVCSEQRKGKADTFLVWHSSLMMNQRSISVAEMKSYYFFSEWCSLLDSVAKGKLA